MLGRVFETRPRDCISAEHCRQRHRVLHLQIQLQEKLLLMALMADDKLGGKLGAGYTSQRMWNKGTLHTKQRNRSPEI